MSTAQERYLDKAHKVWGDRWDYSDSMYTRAKDPISIRCKEHDVVFTQTARKHLAGQVGCKTCHVEHLSRIKSGQPSPKRMSQEKFLTKSTEVWGDRWDYSKVEYQTTDDKVTIICKVHGEFAQAPYSHLKGHVGCVRCRTESILPPSPRPSSQEKFLTTAQEVWEGRWDYSSLEWRGMYTPTEFTCSIHGPFIQTPRAHLRGTLGCKKCLEEEKTAIFIQRSFSLWGDRWDYSKTHYIHSQKPVVITCKTHGDFIQVPSHHLNKRVGCRSCSRRTPYTTGEFIRASEARWGERWDYSEVSYSTTSDKVTIICKEHGPFTQLPASHLRGCVGCKQCGYNYVSTEEFISRADDLWGGRWDYSEVDYVHYKYNVEIVCKLHGSFIQSPSNHLSGYIGCLSCQSRGVSVGEEQVRDFIESLGLIAEYNRRDLIPYN